MKNKSKFLTFLLSFIPGLSHFYLGYPDRGLIYLIIFAVIGLASFFMAIATRSTIFIFLFVVGEVLVWLIALIDAFSSIGNIYDKEREEMKNPEEVEQSNKKIITLALSIIPGAGHMYLGDQKRGLVFMSGFFFSIFFMGWLNLSFMLFLLPLIWFYSFFDAFHILSGEEVEELDLVKIFPKIQHKHIGIGLIVLGIVIILQKIIYPIVSIYLDYRIKNYIQTSIVSLIFIIGGIRMLSQKKKIGVEVENHEEERD